MSHSIVSTGKSQQAQTTVPSSLVNRTLLPNPASGEGWRVRLYESAGEAVAHWPLPQRAQPESRRQPRVEEQAKRAEGNKSRSSRRAKGQVRRYAKANKLNRLWTLTYAEGQFDRQRASQDIRRFLERVQTRYGRQPILLVLEWHPGGHGLHVHALAGRFIPQQAIQLLWGHGIVHLKQIRARGGQSATGAAAQYASKYISKEMDAPPRSHRYYITEGWQPEAIEGRVRAKRDVLDWCLEAMGGQVPAYTWDSDDADEWEGPPTLFIMWDV